MTTKKWLDLGLFAIALFLFFALRSGLHFMWETFSLPTWNMVEGLPFTAADIIALAAIAGTFVGVRQIKTVDGFGQEVVVELSKVTWPERRETVLSTGVVLVMLTIASVILFFIDFLWGTLSKWILARGTLEF